ncbi:hypothetical protein SNEBB_010387 [Seison nebaliae]|nr:hypothetical protein SNEBB_010387 [Seison nebaliae]
MEDISEPYTIKVVTTGPAETGKSCLIKRYCEKRFVNKYLMTIGIDYGVTTYTSGDEKMIVNIFDMGGQTFFYNVRNEFYTDYDVILLCYDITDLNSFSSLKFWLSEIKDESKKLKTHLCYLCGTKLDQAARRQVDLFKVKKFALENNFHDYFEVSSLSGENVDKLFSTIFDNSLRIMKSQVTADDIRNESQLTSLNVKCTISQEQEIDRVLLAKTCHERLNIPTNANKDEINNAYRRLAKMLHPDKNRHPKSEDAFKLVGKARTELLK